LSWTDVEACIADARLSLGVGATDTGKSTMVAGWASMLCRAGKRCAVVDADVGQSDIGPAGTIGMGRVRAPVDRLSEIEAESLHFVGSFSPRNRSLECLVGVRRLVDKARLDGADHILVDTTGFLQGPLGRALKLNKVEVLEPDLLICLERTVECRFLSRAFRHRKRPRVILLDPPAGVRNRSYPERISNRLRSLRRHFEGARPEQVDLKTVGLFNWPVGQGFSLPEGVRRSQQWIGEESLGILAPEEFFLRMVGVEDVQGEIQALGVVERLDVPGLTVRVWTPPSVTQIGGLRYGDVQFDREAWRAIRDQES
jgi:polynucleotide 5'-kinase involved in rRNA processing